MSGGDRRSVGVSAGPNRVLCAALALGLALAWSPGVVRGQGSAPVSIQVGEAAIGHLGDGATDRYAFDLAARERIAVSVSPVADGSVRISILDPAGAPLVTVGHTTPDVPWSWVGQLPSGAYQVVIGSATGSAVDYRLDIERLDPFAISQDQEPNGSPDDARPMPPFLTVAGGVDGDDDVDWYRFGPLAAPAALTFTATGGAAISVTDGTQDYPTVGDHTGGRRRSVLLPAGRPLYLEVAPTGPYRIHIDGGVPTPSGRPIPARLLEAEVIDATIPASVAAGWPAAQRVHGELSVLNEGRDPRQLTVDAVTSDDAWSVVIDQPTIELGGSATVVVPLVVVVPPFARPAVTVRATIRLRDADGSQATGFVDVTPTVGAAPITDP